MELFIPLINATLLGMLIPLTIRWGRLLYAAHKIKSNQGEPLDRMIDISSEDILKGVIRKRSKQAYLIMDNSDTYDTISMDDKPISIPIVTSDGIKSIYNSLKEKGLSIYLIPNEDIHIALQKELLSDYSKYFLNDEINQILHSREMKVVEEKKREEDAKKALIEKRKQLEEQQRKQKEQQIEDSIKI